MMDGWFADFVLAVFLAAVELVFFLAVFFVVKKGSQTTLARRLRLPAFFMQSPIPMCKAIMITTPTFAPFFKPIQKHRTVTGGTAISTHSTTGVSKASPLDPNNV